MLFSSARGQGAFPNVATLYTVPAEGGMERPVPTDWGSNGSYSADGTKLAFTRHPSVWSRQHYRGQYAADLWVMDVAAKKYTHLGDADYKGNYFWPMYGRNGEIYFVADRVPNEKGIQFNGPEVMRSANNIWKISERGGEPVQVTHHASGNLYFPSISADGRTIVYEENFGLWKLDTATGKIERDPGGYQIGRERERFAVTHRPQRSRFIPPFTFEQASRDYRARGTLHHRYR